MARKQKEVTPTKRLFRDPSGQEHLFEKSLEEELEAKENALVECLGMTFPNGDSDSIACIAGSISGAYLGVDAIPESWIAGIEKTGYLNDLAYRLAEKKESLNG